VNGKKIRLLVLGSLSILAGALLGAGSIRAVGRELRVGALGAWEIADTVLRLVVAAYFVWIGVRAIRRVDEDVVPTKIGWGRALLGVTFLYANIRGHFVPNPRALQPDNEIQSATMQFMTGLLYLVSIGLIIAGFHKKQQPHKPAATLPEEKDSATGKT
jgi:hypothetical protein